MSGHYKWHNIQAKKGKADATRSSMFTKLSRAITMAARQGGGDPEMNFSLRLAVDKAKETNVPRENIERAIKRGTGELTDTAELHEVLYEGFGPGGVAVLIDTNRTVSDVKHLLSKHGGSLGGPGSVLWQFTRSGVIRFSSKTKQQFSDWDAAQLACMDAGAEDILDSPEGAEIMTPYTKLQSVLRALAPFGIVADDSGLEWHAKEIITVDREAEEQLDALYSALEALDDVRGVFTNLA